MKSQGFTLMELMIAIAIMGLISTIAMPGFRRAVEKVQEVGCIQNRGVAEDLEQVFAFEVGRHTNSMQELVQYKYLKKLPLCPGGGNWSWASYPLGDAKYKTILECTVHGLRFAVGTATVTVNASDYSAKGGRWFEDGTDMWTAWRGQWLEYKFDFTEGKGTYNLGITAKNHPGGEGWTNVSGYENFRVEVYVDDKKQGDAYIPASDDTYNTGNFAINIPDAGYHNVKLRWINDAYNPGAHQDANIRFREVSFSGISLEKE